MAQELRIPLEEAEDCNKDLLEMEREEFDLSREAKVIAACRDMVGQWDKDMKPVQQVLEEEPETDDQSLSEEEYETPPDEPYVAVDLPEQEQRGSELVESAEGDEEQKGSPDSAEAAHSIEKDCSSQETEGEREPEAPPLEVFTLETAGLGECEGGRWLSQGD